MLFTWDDMAMLKGGLTIPATLHEMLLHKKRRLLLEPEAYTQLAARLLAGCVQSATTFIGVPIAATGTVEEVEGSLKVTYLHGQVLIHPIFSRKFQRPPESKHWNSLNNGDQYEELGADLNLLLVHC